MSTFRRTPSTAPNMDPPVRTLGVDRNIAGGGPFPDLPLRLVPPAPAGRIGLGAGTADHQPQLPADPVGALLHGLHVPALPGTHEAMAPVLSLLHSFGTGTFDTVNPVRAFRVGAQVIDTTMQLGAESLETLMMVWQGAAARSAQASGQRIAGRGAQTGMQGKTIADITNRASITVNKGYTALTAIAADFAGKMVALGPSLLTPPGQLALMRLAATNLARSEVVVTRAQTELGALGAEINAAGGLLGILGNSGIDLPTAAGQALGTAQPAASRMAGALTEIGDRLGRDPEELAGLDASPVSDEHPLSARPPTTDAASLGRETSDDVPMASGTAPAPPAPAMLPTLDGPNGTRLPPVGAPAAPGIAGTTAMNAAPTGMAPTAVLRESTHDHSRSVQPHHGPGRRATDGLSPVAPAVVGAEDPDEDGRYEHRYDNHAGTGETREV